MTQYSEMKKHEPREFQVVVLAGGDGNRMSSLTKHQCKAMLKIANKPMIYYCLKNIINHLLKDILIIVKEEDSFVISEYIKEEFLSNNNTDNLNITILPLPPKKDNSICHDDSDCSQDDESINNTMPWGTAEAIFYFKDYIKTDFIVISCDVVGYFDLYALISIFRLQLCACAVLLCEKDFLEVSKKPNKNQANVNVNYFENSSWVCLDENEKKLIAIKDSLSLSNGDVFSIEKLNLFYSPNCVINSEILDLHVYIFRHSVLRLSDYCEKKILEISSIKYDLLPFLIALQHTEACKIWSSSRWEVNVFDSALKKLDPVFDLNNITSNDLTHHDNEDICDINSDPMLSIINNRKTEYTAAKPPPTHSAPCRVLYFLQKLRAGYVSRVNNNKHYHEYNMKFCVSRKDDLAQVMPYWIIPNLPFDQVHANVSAKIKDSVIDDSFICAKSVVVIKCVIGKNVTIDHGTKLSYCVLMDNISIGKNSILQHCTVSKNVTIVDSCKLTNCVIEKNCMIVEGSKFSDETIINTRHAPILPAEV